VQNQLKQIFHVYRQRFTQFVPDRSRETLWPIISFPSVVFQHFSKTEKQGWLTRWSPWSLTSPIWHSTPLCLHWSTIALL